MRNSALETGLVGTCISYPSANKARFIGCNGSKRPRLAIKFVLTGGLARRNFRFRGGKAAPTVAHSGCLPVVQLRLISGKILSYGKN